MQAQAKERRQANEPTRHPGPCEVAGYLVGVRAWERWLPDYLHGRPYAEREYHRNHVWGQKGECDEAWNVVVMSEAAHEFEDKCWQWAGLLVCMKALSDRGDLQADERFYHKRLGYYPFGKLCNAVEGGAFSREPVLLGYAHELLTAYGYGWPLVTPHQDDFGFGL